MSFLESIQLKNGQVRQLDYHQKRLDLTLQKHGNFPRKWDLKTLFQAYNFPQKGLYKIRVVYDAHQIDINWQAYQIKPVDSLQVVYTDHIEYSFKTTDRNELHQLYEQRKQAHDIIICKNGWITDSYYANLALYEKGQWFTPDQPLLAGTKRQFLIDQKSIHAIPIRLEDLRRFEKIALINAMIDLDDQVWIEQSAVYF